MEHKSFRDNESTKDSRDFLKQSHVDFCPDETLLMVFGYLTAMELCTAAQVCSLWHNLSKEGSLWKRLVLQKWATQKILPLLEVNNSQEWKELYKIIVDPTNLGKLQDQVASKGLEASSTDKDQEIHHTLSPYYFWGSKASLDPESDEFLIYKLSQPLCFVRGIELEAMKNVHTYAPKKIRFLIGFEPKKYHFTSKEYNYENNPNPQFFELPENVPGGYMRIDLIGKHSTHFVQQHQTKYYLCISSVRVEAIPIGGYSSTLLITSLLNKLLKEESFRKDLEVRGFVNWKDYSISSLKSSTTEILKFETKDAQHDINDNKNESLVNDLAVALQNDFMKHSGDKKQKKEIWEEDEEEGFEDVTNNNPTISLIQSLLNQGFPPNFIRQLLGIDGQATEEEEDDEEYQ